MEPLGSFLLLFFPPPPSTVKTIFTCYGGKKPKTKSKKSVFLYDPFQRFGTFIIEVYVLQLFNVYDLHDMLSGKILKDVDL